MEFLLLPSGPSLLLLLLHAGAIRIWEHQEDRILGIPVFQFGCNIFRSSRGPPPLAVSHKPTKHSQTDFSSKCRTPFFGEAPIISSSPVQINASWGTW